MGSKHLEQFTPDCHEISKVNVRQGKYRWARLLLPVTGLAALIWFLLRVIPKPSRATYPCQRVAFPLASSFVIWLLGLGGSIAAIRKARVNLAKARPVVALVCILLSVGSVWLALSMTSEKPLAAAQPHPVNSPLGTAKGIHPGRVVWVHDPDATSWDGSTGYWWQSGNTDQTVVSDMLNRAIRRLGGNYDPAGAWDGIFRYYNQQHGKGDVGYVAGEKIMIKVNFVGCLTTATYLSSSQYDLADSWGKETYPNTSPQMMMALLDQLVNEAGVAEANISIGDPTAFFPNEFYNLLHAVFPSVHYLDHPGDNGRTEATTLLNEPFAWSMGVADGKTQDEIPDAYVEAAYLISMANLKGHYDQAGITLCAKNHYGSLYRRPNAGGYYDMHGDLPFTNGTEGSYRNLVDLMGHENLGGKTVLCIIDGLYAAKHALDNVCAKWDLAPFGNDWTNSVFVSQDPVAIDSVGFDFIYAEWPENPGPAVSGTDDYLHEAALADNPPSGSFYDPEDDGTSMSGLGVHEHWNNPVDKQYSRNLGTGEGIELVMPPVEEISSDLNYDGTIDFKDFAMLAADWDGTGMSELADMVADWLRVAVAIPPVTVYDGDFVLPWLSQTTGGSAPVAWQDLTAPDATEAAYCNIVPGEIWRWTRINTDGTKTNIGQRRYLEFNIYFDTTVKPGHKLSAVHMEVNDEGEWGYKWESKTGVGDSYCWLDGVYMDMDGGIPDNDLPMAGNEWHHFKLDLTTNIDGRVWPEDPDVGKILLCFGHDAGDGVDVYIKNVKFTAAAGNEAPYVYAGGDLTINLPETSTSLDAMVYDDGLPDPPAAVSVTWEKVSGPDTVVFGDAHAVDTSVTFPGAGVYVLRLTADDGELTASDEVQVSVRDAGYPAGSVIVFADGGFENLWQVGQEFSIATSPDSISCAYTNGSGWRTMDASGGTTVGRTYYMEFDAYFNTDQQPGTSINNIHMEINGDGGWTYKWDGSKLVEIDGVPRSWSSASVSGKAWHHYRFKLTDNSNITPLPADPMTIGVIRFRSDSTIALYLNNVAFTPY